MLGAAGGWITTVGSAVGMAAGYGSGAAAAGLAILGGGTLASGGFGMAGGAFVIAALTGAATGVITDISISVAADAILKEPYRRYEYIKVPLIEKKGSKDVRNIVKELKEVEENFAKEKIGKEEFENETNRLSSELINKASNVCESKQKDKNSLFDAINIAILSYNKQDEEIQKLCWDSVWPHAKNGSFLNYLSALNLLSEGQYEKAIKDLETAVAKEPTALQPYILYIMSLNDLDEHKKSLKVAKDGLKNVSKKNYHLLFAAGNASFYLKDYDSAANYYEKAYNAISEDMIKTDTAMMAAISYHEADDNKSAWKWYERALKTLGKNNEDYKAEITRRWSDITNET
ncbi:hypothetical protein CKO25_11105 [Thiocapsa imhoffii]|uniref:Tetratricopeptide repeat protein n=2 Tax=Thiocapsa imhoffii TaxID=382777 RepID=A0A9X1B9D3_9GAMM|nr:hypothetical protein [Thiocapsa imhoffii]